MEIKFRLGDYSGDGHEKTEILLFEANHTPKEIRDAYKKASAVADWEYHEQCFADYEDSALSEDAAEILLEKFNIDVAELYDISFEDEYSSCMDIEDVCDLFLQIAKTQLPDLTWELTPAVKEDYVVGGWGDHMSLGYGLFE